MSKRMFIVDRDRPQSVRVAIEAIRSFLMEGKGEVRIEMVQHRKRRTDRQNRYYWPCFVQPFADFLRAQAEAPCGADDADETAHSLLKAQFLAKTVNVGGRDRRFVGSTTTLTTQEFNDYLDRCRAFLEGLGIRVPEPNIYHEPADRDERVTQIRRANEETAETAETTRRSRRELPGDRHRETRSAERSAQTQRGPAIGHANGRR